MAVAFVAETRWVSIVALGAGVLPAALAAVGISITVARNADLYAAVRTAMVVAVFSCAVAAFFLPLAVATALGASGPAPLVAAFLGSATVLAVGTGVTSWFISEWRAWREREIAAERSIPRQPEEAVATRDSPGS